MAFSGRTIAGVRGVRRLMIAICVGCVTAIAVLPGAALATAPRPQLAPAEPTLKTPITVTWKAKPAKKGLRYLARLSVRGSFESGLNCVGYADAALRPTRRGYTGTLRPVPANAGSFWLAQWCPGSALVTVIRRGPGRLSSGVLTGARLPIVLGPGEQQPTEPSLAQTGVPVKISVLGGSTLTASAAGRPDRSAQLTGVLRGMIPGRFKPNTEVSVEQISGSLTPLATGLAQGVFPPDPLCPDTTPPATFDAVPASSTMLLKASGDTAWNLTLNGAPSQLFGCGPSGPLTGTTTLALAGHVGPKGLLELQQTASVTGIALPGGSQGGLAASLVLNVDLSGRG